MRSDPPTEMDTDATARASGRLTLSRQDRVTRPRRGRGEIPKINVFKNDPGTDGSVSFAEWKHDVKILLDGGYEESALHYEIIRSLQGLPGKLARSLEEGLSLQALVDKLELNYGTSKPFQRCLATFSALYQYPRERVVSFAGRLAQSFGEILSRFPQKARVLEELSPRRDVFYEGLKPELRHAIGFLYAGGATYEELLRLARRREDEGEDYPPSQRDQQHSGYPRKDGPCPWYGNSGGNHSQTSPPTRKDHHLPEAEEAYEDAYESTPLDQGPSRQDRVAGRAGLENIKCH